MRRLLFLVHILFIGHVACARTYVHNNTYTYMIVPNGDILRVTHDTYQEIRLHLGLNCVDIALTSTHLYVLNASKCLLFVIDPSTFSLIDSVKLADFPLTLFVAPQTLFILHRNLDLFLMANTLLSIVSIPTLSLIKEIKLETPLPFAHLSSTHFLLTGYGCNTLVRFKIETLELDTEIPLKGTVIKLCADDESVFILSYDQMKKKSYITALQPHRGEPIVMLEKYQHVHELHCIQGFLMTSDRETLDVLSQDQLTTLCTHHIDSLPNIVTLLSMLVLVFTDSSQLHFFDHDLSVHLSTLTLKDVPNYMEIYGDFLILSHAKIPQLTVIDLVSREVAYEFPTPRARPILVRTPEYLYVDGKKFLKLEKDPV